MGPEGEIRMMRKTMGLTLALMAGAIPAAWAQDTAATLFVPDTLGVQVAYIEHQVGPAWKVQGAERLYKLGPCVLTLTTQHGQVTGMAMDVNAACNPNLQGFLANATPVKAFPQTFGSIQKIVDGDEYGADCLTMCGNAADPNLYMITRGFHANNFLDVQFTSTLVDDTSIAASEAWAKALTQQHGEDYVTNTTFNCDASKDAQAIRFLAPAKVTRVTVGTDLNPTGCKAH
jgi:hypothetical protein